MTADVGPGDVGTAVDEAFRQGSQDNLTVQIIRLDAVPDRQASEVFGQSTELPLSKMYEAGCRYL